MSGPSLFPVFLKLGGRKVLVVGGGSVASSKIEGLLSAGAEVTVVAPRIDDRIRASAVTLLDRAFVDKDVEDAWLVVAAATPAVNRDVRAAAEARRVFVNAVDDPDNATAFLAGVFRRGPVAVAVSTGGAAPALAGLLREALEAMVPEEVESWVDEARTLRARQRAEKVPLAARRPLLLQALNALYAGREVAPEARA